MLKLRQSLLNDYKTCPYMAKMNWGEPGSLGSKENRDREESNGMYAEVGIAFHELMELWGNHKVNKTVLHESEYHRLLDEKFDKITIEIFDETLQSLQKSGNSNVRNKYEQYTADSFRNEFRESVHEQLEWALEACDSNQILSNEWSFEIENLLPDMLPFTGTVDRIDGDMTLKDITLMDYKTGRVYTKKQLEENMQACIYALAFRAKYGFLPKEFVFIFTKHKKKKRVRITEEFLSKNIANITSIYHKMEKGEWEFNKKNKHFCMTFCEHYKECPGYKKRGNSWDNFK